MGQFHRTRVTSGNSLKQLKGKMWILLQILRRKSGHYRSESQGSLSSTPDAQIDTFTTCQHSGALHSPFQACRCFNLTGKIYFCLWQQTPSHALPVGRGAAPRTASPSLHRSYSHLETQVTWPGHLPVLPEGKTKAGRVSKEFVFFICTPKKVDIYLWIIHEQHSYFSVKTN